MVRIVWVWWGETTIRYKKIKLVQKGVIGGHVISEGAW